MLTTAVRVLTPQKVISRALELGIHNVCLEVDFDKSCDSCRVIMNQAMDEFYGNASNIEEALEAILSDIMEEYD